MESERISVVFLTLDERKRAIRNLKSIFKYYGELSLHDFYFACDIRPEFDSDDDEKHGWKDLSGIELKKEHGVYAIYMPEKIETLNK